MTIILFVDSDQEALDAQLKPLAEIRPDWVLMTANTGKQALELVKAQSIDTVISETVLTDMSGFDLLGNLRANFPQTIRLTLSAETDAEVVLESAKANHRFIAKPTTTLSLATAIDCSLRLRSFMQHDDLAQLVNNIDSLPALPAIYNDMMTELASPNGSLLAVGGIVEKDTGLTVTVLRIVNSTFYGLSQRVESVAQGVTLLGVHLIKNIALTAKVFSQFKGSQLSLRRLSQLNDQAIKMGALSNQFGRYAKVSRSTNDHSQMAGMLANVGELIAAILPEGASGKSEFSNELVGAYLLRLWLLPDPIVEAVALQHESPPKFVDSVTPLVILHAIRYLQDHFTDVNNEQQRENCQQYLESFISEDVVDLWLNAYEDLEQLTSSQTQRAA
ncbi:MAG: HDOD domain-containing protein [Granulosicoccus sp.]